MEQVQFDRAAVCSAFEEALSRQHGCKVTCRMVRKEGIHQAEEQ